MRRWSAALLAGALLLGCAGDDDDTDTATTTSTTATTEPAAGVRLNEIQVIGSHNSYHLQVDSPIFSALQGFVPELAETLEYGHLPLPEQFDLGVRQIELDVFADPDGGRYASPAGLDIVGLPNDLDPVMQEPGFKVLHVQDVDFRSTCVTFVACLTEIRNWSAANPDHVPIMVLVEVKDDPVPSAPAELGFVEPPPITAADLDALDAEIRSVFDDDHLLTPDDVRGDHESLEEAVTTDGWPLLDDVRGQVLFALDNEGDVRDLYVDGHTALEGRVLFTSSPRGTPEAAFLKLNDAVGSAEEIRQAVLDGYVVRTRADADTREARTGDTTTRDAALASGAQWVSTDYPVDDPRFEPDYSVTLPEGGEARCNPVNAPPGCEL